MNTRDRRRGQPLIALGAVLLGWVGLRAALWEEIVWPGLSAPAAKVVASQEPAPYSPRAPHVAPGPRLTAKVPPLRPLAAAPLPLPTSPALLSPPRPPVVPLDLPPVFTPVSKGEQAARVAAAHQLAWMAGVAQLPLPRFVTDRINASDQGTALVPPEPRQARVGLPAARRWSSDGWLLLRQGGAGITAAGLPSPTYGASQAGAVIRYRLAPTNAHRPTLYLRATSAVQVPRGEELGIGLAGRPLARVPLALQAELRATQQSRGTTWRPAVGAVTELPRFDLVAGLEGEIYAQAGYVAGPGATIFADGQLRIDRRVARLGRGELRAGLGAWGGAQKGANRVDIGPAATLDFPAGGGQARLSADWRLRAGGNAAPKSGPALTLSAGF